MSVHSVDSIDRSVHKTNEWLKQLTDDLKWADREDAWRVLKSYLQVLRDELTADEAAQLAAQLPMVVRGAFYEGYDPGHQPAKLRHRDEFLARFAERALLPDRERTEQAVQAVTRVLEGHVTEGELDDVLVQLPSKVREVLQHT